MGFREKLRIIIFGTDTPAGKMFDIVLILAILFSVLVVMIESIPWMGPAYPEFFRAVEWTITIMFTLEYITRVYISFNPKKYILGFWGIIDFISVLPAFLEPFFEGTHYLSIVRILRLLRIFRILKMIQFIGEIQIMLIALRKSFRKIAVFLSSVGVLAIILGSAMYVAEGQTNGFTSIPQSIYWAIVTITTVGYGDVVPLTIAGKIIASVIMLMGYSIIAVPTGVVTVEYSRALSNGILCDGCGNLISVGHKFCGHCGASAPPTDGSQD